MQINSISMPYNVGQNAVQLRNISGLRLQNQLKNDTFQRSNVTFGWCEPHVQRGSEISMIFNETLRQQQKIAEIERKKGALLDTANKSAMDATKFVLNFANRQKGEAEFVPLWTIKSNPVLQKTMDDSPIFGDPVQNLIALNNVSKFKMNNPKFSEQMNNQAAGSLQLHTTMIMAEQAKRNLEKSNLSAEDKKEVEELLELVQDKVDEVFGEGTYQKLLDIGNMGKEPTIEQKRESNRILIDIDHKARRFDFGEEFRHRLEHLVEKQHEKLHQKNHHHHHHDVEHVEEDNNIEVLYHTHEHGEHHHHHH